MSDLVVLPQLSVIVITKNEAANIADCLASVAFAGEVVVLDSGSQDGTVEIAKQMGARVFKSDQWLGFGVQKNRALNLATKEWILSIDADERVSPQLAIEIKNGLKSNVNHVFEIPRQTYFCGQMIKYCGWSPDKVTRLFRRGDAKFNENLVHESLQVINNNIRLKSMINPIVHFSYRTPNDYWKKMKYYSDAWAQQKFKEGKAVSFARVITSSVYSFLKSYIIRLGFLDGAMGFVVCQMQAQATFYKYFQLYFLNRQKNQ